MSTEQLKSLALRAFAVEFANAPIREGESRDAARASIEKAAQR